jgi:hypothetical protein
MTRRAVVIGLFVELSAGLATLLVVLVERERHPPEWRCDVSTQMRSLIDSDAALGVQRRPQPSGGLY